MVLYYLILGLYKDSEKGILEGACGPVLIHTDQSKTKEQEKKERERQRTGEAASEHFGEAKDQYKKGITIPEMKVLTTANGSMTQETFLFFSRHFVESLGAGHGPVF